MQRLPQLPPRQRDSHKGDFGRVLIVGGSAGMAGAPSLAALAALRSGAGLVMVACPDAIRSTVTTLAPCATTCSMTAADYARFDPTVIAVGPGSGDELTQDHLLEILADFAVPTVVDADGLNTLARIEKWFDKTRENVVLTPHPGEMKRLIENTPIAEPTRSRSDLACAVAELSHSVVVLKGHETAVSNGQHTYINQTGNPGMASGGSGDVLSGVIAALAALGLVPFEAACLGVYLHGLAGDLAARKFGEVSMIATDIIDALPEAFRSHAADA